MQLKRTVLLVFHSKTAGHATKIQKHQSTKTHKTMVINPIYFSEILCFSDLKEKRTFRSGLKIKLKKMRILLGFLKRNFPSLSEAKRVIDFFHSLVRLQSHFVLTRWLFLFPKF